MADGSVAGHSFQLHHGGGMWTASQCLLQSAVLITQGNLQMKDRLSVALKPEVSRLNYSGMYRSYSYLVGFSTFYLVEITTTGQDLIKLGAAPGIVPASQ